MTAALKPNIRPAKKEDLDVLWELENLCFQEEAFHKQQLRYLLLEANSLFMVATIDDRIVGSIIVLLQDHTAHAKIYSLNVHPGYRRASIGSSLLDTAIRLLREKAFKKMTLEVGVSNTAAQRLYRAKGFIVDKQLPRYYKSGEDALHFVRKL